jgi:fatty acid desaturase
VSEGRNFRFAPRTWRVYNNNFNCIYFFLLIHPLLPQPHSLTPPSAVTCSIYVWPFFVFTNRMQAVTFATIPITIYSLLFMTCTQVNHHSDETSSPSAQRSNWYRHQTGTSHNIVPISKLVNFVTFFFTGGLNLQIEHHLFPCVNHWHLRVLQPAIEVAARRHGASYPKSESMGQAIWKLWVHLADLSVKPEKVE